MLFRSDAAVRGYPQHWGVPPAAMRDAADFVVLVTPIDAPAPEGAVGGRIELTGRHTMRQILDMACGDVQRHLFCREWLVPSSSVPQK